TRDETTCTVIAARFLVDAVEFLRGFRFFGDVERLFCGNLHPRGEFVARDSGIEIQFARMSRKMFAVDRLNKIKLPSLRGTEEMVGRIEVQNTRFRGTHLCPLIDGRKPAAGPMLAGKLRQPAWIGHRNVRGQVASFGPERISQPASQRWPAAPKTPAIQRIK